jgi:CRISPR/Cas system CSM-associated protein Csm2 small subunit
MYRKSTAGVMSNNTIVYNRLVNKKTKNITNVPVDRKDRQISNDNEIETKKVKCTHLYNYSMSNRAKKSFNNREKFYRITDDDIDFCDDDDDDY